MSEKSKKKSAYIVGSGNVISQFFFLWIFKFIFILRKTKDMKELLLELRKSETADYNDCLLEKKWSLEKEKSVAKHKTPSIKKALFKTFGLRFLMNGVYKILWGIVLWLGAYWLLKQTVALVRDMTKPNMTLTRNKSHDQFEGQMYALGFLLSSIFASIFIHQMISQSGRLGLRVSEYILFRTMLLFMMRACKV